MSFLIGRLAATEGAFFSQTSKQAIARLQETKKPVKESSSCTNDGAPDMADVLPEILKHSLPAITPGTHGPPQTPTIFSPSPSSLVASLASQGPSDTTLSQSQLLELTGPLSYIPSLPQASFGSARWRPPRDELNFLPSTANEASMEGRPTMDDAQAKALAEGYFSVFKAFLVATAIIAGGATVGGGIVASRLGIHSLDDIRTKGQDHMRSKAQAIQQSFEPWKLWVQKRNKQWSMEEDKLNGLRSPSAETLGLKQLLKNESNGRT